jgi:dihydrofolate reductase
MGTETKHQVIAIAAIGATSRALGKNNDLIWKIPADMKRFRKVTKGHPVIMGSKTYESLPRKPLPDRTNIVLTRNLETRFPNEVIVAASPVEALDTARLAPGGDKIYIIGGGEIYKALLPYTDMLDLTLIEESTPTEADVYFPEYPEFTDVLSEEPGEHDGTKYTYVTLTRK